MDVPFIRCSNSTLTLKWGGKEEGVVVGGLGNVGWIVRSTMLPSCGDFDF